MWVDEDDRMAKVIKEKYAKGFTINRFFWVKFHQLDVNQRRSPYIS